MKKHIYEGKDLRCEITIWAGNIYLELQKRYLYFFWTDCDMTKSMKIDKDVTTSNINSLIAELFKDYYQVNDTRERIKGHIQSL